MSTDKNSNLILNIKKIEYTKVSNLRSVTVNAANYNASLNWVAGVSWTEIYFSPGTAKFAEKEKETEAGNYFDQQLECFYPGEDSDNVVSFEELKALPVVIRITLCNGNQKLLGSPDNPAKIKTGLSISAKDSGCSIKFNRTGQRAPWL